MRQLAVCVVAMMFSASWANPGAASAASAAASAAASGRSANALTSTANAPAGPADAPAGTTNAPAGTVNSPVRLANLPARAAHTPGRAAAAAVAGGVPVCTIRDRRLTEISGLVVTRDGYAVVNDSTDDADRRKVFFLDRSCAVTRTVSYPSRPRDTEDMAMAADGTIWVADTGDNGRSRRTVALWKLGAGAERPRLYRLSYPDGAHDAEALVLDGDGGPLVVTKDPGVAGLYAPVRPPRPADVTAMAKVGEYRLPATTTSNPFSVLGHLVVTGAANAPGGDRVVLRTYADAIEFDVPDGDVARAITTGTVAAGTARITPLPDEPQGESIAYTGDGTGLLTVSESADLPAGSHPVIRRYTPTPAAPPSDDEPADTAPAAPSPDDEPADTAPADAAAAEPSVGHARGPRPNVDRRGALIVAAGALGVIIVVAGAFGIRRGRRGTPRT